MIFFDIDGTLLNHAQAEMLAAVSFKNRFDVFNDISGENFAEKWHELAEKHISIYLEGHTSFVGQRRARIRELFDSEIEDEECDSLFNEYLNNYEENWSLYPDVLECLRELEEYQLGIISNGDSYQQRRKLEKLGVLEFFSFIVISDEVGVSKPHRDIFIHACNVSGYMPIECSYVGDNFILDAEGSRNSGINGIWLNRERADHPNAGLTIVSLSELKDKLTK